MKTHSIWGKPPTRLYKFIKLVESRFGNNANICIVGASDGKFVMPFLRKGHSVTAYEIDNVAIYGGEKEFPIRREHVEAVPYTPHPDRNPLYEKVPMEVRRFPGLKRRSEQEGLSRLLKIVMENFYKNPPVEEYNAVFTSCSIPYPCNFDIPVKNIIDALKNAVVPRGFLYMDYMMPLEERHSWRPEHYFRSGDMERLLINEEWKIIHIREMQKPVFEAAHADRPEDHFHRFGYVLAEHIPPIATN